MDRFLLDTTQKEPALTEKLRIVLSVLKGETTQVDVALLLQLSQTTVAKWQKQFLEGGRESPARGDNAVTLVSRRERRAGGMVVSCPGHAMGSVSAALRRAASPAERREPA